MIYENREVSKRFGEFPKNKKKLAIDTLGQLGIGYLVRLAVGRRPDGGLCGLSGLACVIEAEHPRRQKNPEWLRIGQ